MSDNKKFTREEIAAELEAKANALRENKISDEDIEKMSAGCSACCGGCQYSSDTCFFPTYNDCYRSCVNSSPN